MNPPPVPAAPPPSSTHRPRRHPAGFTLVEIWVSLLVVTAIAGVSLAAFRGRTKVQTIRRERDQIAADLRAMQQWSLSGKALSICVDGVSGQDVAVCGASGACPSGTCSFKVPAGGYGAHLVRCDSTTQSCRYQLFADLDADGKYDGANELIADGNKVLEIPVRTGTLRAYFAAGCSPEESSADVTFTPYSGTARLAGAYNGLCGYSPSGSRLREVITFGPSVTGATVELTVFSGRGGIQER